MQKINKNNINKKNISKTINYNTGISVNYVNKIIDDFLNIFKEKIKEKNLNIKNFGTFKVLNKKERYGRNPKNKKLYKISARKSLSFIASKKLNDKII